VKSASCFLPLWPKYSLQFQSLFLIKDDCPLLATFYGIVLRQLCPPPAFIALPPLRCHKLLVKWSVSLVLKGPIHFQMTEAKHRKSCIAPLSHGTGIILLRGTLPQSFLSILLSHLVMTTDLHQNSHLGRVLQSSLGITSPEIPVYLLP